jgi:manganese transport protein
VNAPPPPSSDALALPASGAAGVHPPLGESDLATPLRVTRARGRVRGTLALLGPAFVAAVAYIDPGNFATNITAGAGMAICWCG